MFQVFWSRQVQVWSKRMKTRHQCTIANAMMHYHINDLITFVWNAVLQCFARLFFFFVCFFSLFSCIVIYSWHFVFIWLFVCSVLACWLFDCFRVCFLSFFLLFPQIILLVLLPFCSDCLLAGWLVCSLLLRMLACVSACLLVPSLFGCLTAWLLVISRFFAWALAFWFSCLLAWLDPVISWLCHCFQAAACLLAWFHLFGFLWPYSAWLCLSLHDAAPEDDCANAWFVLLCLFGAFEFTV